MEKSKGMERAVRVIETSLEALQTSPSSSRHSRFPSSTRSSGSASSFAGTGFERDAVVAITSQLLSSQEQSRKLQEENERLSVLLKGSRPENPMEKRASRACVETELRLLEETVDSSIQSWNQKEQVSKSLQRSTENWRSQVASVKLLLASAQEENEQLRAMLEQERVERAKSEKLWREELAKTKEMNANLQDQYSRLYEFLTASKDR